MRCQEQPSPQKPAGPLPTGRGPARWEGTMRVPLKSSWGASHPNSITSTAKLAAKPC